MKKIIIIVLIVSFLLASGIATAQNACCELTKSGDACVVTDASNCSPNGKVAFTSCEQTSFCQIGCCYSSDEGSCSQNTPRASCEQEEGTSFVNSPSCAIPACSKGCCTIGDQAFFVTQTQCKQVGSDYPDANVKFDSGLNTEAACLESARSAEMGCCVNADTATFTTRDNCNVARIPAQETTTQPQGEINPTTQSNTNTQANTETTEPSTTDTTTETPPAETETPTEPSPITGQATAVGTNNTIGNVEGFYPNMLCSNDRLQSGCAKMHHTDCFDGKVYWFDSCGNKENLYYGNNKEASYNNGFVKDPDTICRFTTNNQECGNCDYFQGYLCGEAPRNINPATGDLTCVSLDCSETGSYDYSPNADGETKKNGEAWCSYDYQPGSGSDRPGSRHYRHVCIAGQEIIEECKDFREQICIQGIITDEAYATREGLQNSFLARGDIIQAACRDNRWEQCNALTDKAACDNEDLVDCYWMEGGLTNVTRPFNTSRGSDVQTTPPGICVPEVPPGLAFWQANDNNGEQPVDLGRDSETTPALAESGSALGDVPEQDATEVCSQATRECEVTYEIGGWENLFGGSGKCINNCQCESRDYALSVSNYCQAQGDCGADLNIRGKLTLDGFTIENPKHPNDVLLKTEVEMHPDCTDPNDCSEASKFKKPNILSQLDDNKAWAGLLGIAASGVVSYGIAPAGVEGAFTSGLLAAGGLVQGLFPGGAGFETLIIPFLPEGSILTFSEGASVTGQELIKAGVINTQDLATLGDEALASQLESAGFSLAEDGTITAARDTTINIATESSTLFAQALSFLNIAAWGYTIYSVVDVLLTDYDTYTITLTCSPWQAPRGGIDCESCNEEDRPCSEYKCRSLGQTCRLINKGTSDEKCVNLAPNDVSAPIIKPNPEVLTKGFNINDEGSRGYEITPKLKPFAPIIFGIAMNEPSQCKYDTNSTIEYEKMKYVFGSSQFLYNQTLAVSLPSELASAEALRITNGGLYNIYVKCQDANGNKNDRDYLIRFRIDPTPDLTPPIIEATSIANGAGIAAGQQATDFSIFLNEPVQACKYSSNDVTFDKMENSFQSCSTSGFQTVSKFLSAYECSTRLTNIVVGNNNFYIRCQDKAGNINDESTIFNLRGTEPLEIATSMPNGTLYFGNITLGVETAIGADNGAAICGYTLGGGTFEFSQTGGTTHQDNLNLSGGNYNIPVICTDSAGNEAQTTIKFDIIKDEKAPTLVKVYSDDQSSTIYIETDEKTTCESSNTDFTYGSGIRMDGEDTYEHQALIEGEKIIIICQDIFSNELKITVYP